jgi:hypothetical protein
VGVKKALTIVSDPHIIHARPENCSNYSKILPLFCRHQFTYSGQHTQALARRAAWFEQHNGPAYVLVLYWAPAGHIPTEEEVKERFDHLRRNGATPSAFAFEQRFRADAMPAVGEPGFRPRRIHTGRRTGG